MPEEDKQKQAAKPDWGQRLINAYDQFELEINKLLLENGLDPRRLQVFVNKLREISPVDEKTKKTPSKKDAKEWIAQFVDLYNTNPSFRKGVDRVLGQPISIKQART